MPIILNAETGKPGTAEQVAAQFTPGLHPETAIKIADDLLDVLVAIIAENNTFRETLAGEWGGDPLQDAITNAEQLIVEHLGKEFLDDRLAHR